MIFHLPEAHALVESGALGKVVVVESGPVTNLESKRTAWIASAREIEAEAGNWSVTSFAVCAEL